MNFFSVDMLKNRNFYIKEVTISGDECYLVYPGPGVEWQSNLLIFRSSIWRKKDNFPISLGFKKFFNWTERPLICPDPANLDKTNILSKIDGSLLIISRYKKSEIIRTRGTTDLSEMPNGFEVPFLKSQYPNVFENDLLQSEKYSILCEWTTPTNVIILNYGDTPKLHLVGIINHSNYHYINQVQLDSIAKTLSVPRPPRYNFDSVSNMISSMKELKGIEGVVVYYDKDQEIKKVKTIEYLSLHAFKDKISLDSAIDFYFEFERPKTFKEFYNKIEEKFDFECANMAIPFVSKILDALQTVDKIVDHMISFVTPLKTMSRKEAAEKIISAYGKTNRSSFCFKLLDSKNLSNDDMKKLIYQCIKQ